MKPLSLQVFVGTADDRSIRPHPFYQIHRVTGKMVGTASHESVQAGTKLLDIPLNPENNMTALIDCAGILKLRNSDIELRKGETDVGRKNTRVRLVFRTHLPLAPPVAPPGRVLALQVASMPIECSQRSAQELPVIESVSLTSCSVEGGEELLLSGNNFLPISRVVFMERGTGKCAACKEEANNVFFLIKAKRSRATCPSVGRCPSVFMSPMGSGKGAALTASSICPVSVP
uniref:Nuclear factor of activated T cells 4 n=1 Tax=Echeneis naucrates TaxID=173247 RepID=A0A665UB34_ECHNA